MFFRECPGRSKCSRLPGRKPCTWGRVCTAISCSNCIRKRTQIATRNRAVGCIVICVIYIQHRDCCASQAAPGWKSSRRSPAPPLVHLSSPFSLSHPCPPLPKPSAKIPHLAPPLARPLVLPARPPSQGRGPPLLSSAGRAAELMGPRRGTPPKQPTPHPSQFSMVQARLVHRKTSRRDGQGYTPSGPELRVGSCQFSKPGPASPCGLGSQGQLVRRSVPTQTQFSLGIPHTNMLYNCSCF